MVMLSWQIYTSSSDIVCNLCNSFYLHVCLFIASIISNAWYYIIISLYQRTPIIEFTFHFSSPNLISKFPSCHQHIL